MDNVYYGAPTTPTTDYLAHYGVKGMKWGVRKARESGSDRRMDREFRRAQKKLAKLEKRAVSGKKYAKRAAALGAGAAAAGGLAAIGTSGVATGIRDAGKGLSKASEAIGRSAGGLSTTLGAYATRSRGGNGKLRKLAAAGANAAGAVSRTMGNASQLGSVSNRLNAAGIKNANNLVKWGNSTSISDAARGRLGSYATGIGNRPGRAIAGSTANGLKGISNNTIARIGAAGLGAGLAAGAGYNAYRAATTKRAAKKAAQFRSEMNKAFAGTKYANQVASSGYRPKQKKRRSRR